MTDDRKPLPAEAEMVPLAWLSEHTSGYTNVELERPDCVSESNWKVTPLYALTAAPKATEASGLREALEKIAGIPMPFMPDNAMTRLREVRALAEAALSATLQPLAVPDDGAGRDEVVAWAGKHSSGVAMVTSALSKVLVWRRNGWEIEPLVPASALSAERAAHEQTRRELNAQVARWWSAYGIAFDQAMKNGAAANNLKAEVACLRKALEEREGEIGMLIDELRALEEVTGSPLEDEDENLVGQIERDHKDRAAARSSREEGK